MAPRPLRSSMAFWTSSGGAMAAMKKSTSEAVLAEVVAHALLEALGQRVVLLGQSKTVLRCRRARR
jgi:hypothetical protein